MFRRAAGSWGAVQCGVPRTSSYRRPSASATWCCMRRCMCLCLVAPTGHNLRAPTLPLPRQTRAPRGGCWRRFVGWQRSAMGSALCSCPSSPSCLCWASGSALRGRPCQVGPAGKATAAGGSGSPGQLACAASAAAANGRGGLARAGRTSRKEQRGAQGGVCRAFAPTCPYVYTLHDTLCAHGLDSMCSEQSSMHEGMAESTSKQMDAVARGLG